MKTKILNQLLTVAPALFFTAILAGLLLVRLLSGMVLPGWVAWGLGVAWCVMAFDYLLRAELFKQIGGFAVALIAVVILIGALIPKEDVARYPRMASDEMVQKFESTWNAVYTGNVFKSYSPKQQLIDYGTSLAKFDPFRHGKMILFGLLGFGLAVVYLFPLEPFRCRKASRSRGAGECGSDGVTANPHTPILVYSRTSSRHGSAAYVARFAILFLTGAVFAVQMEFLQVLSPTRMVTGGSILDSCFGFLVGLLVFVPIHCFYALMAEHRAKGSPRFNVLGVGVDAVNMSDCLRKFQEIIEDESPVASDEWRSEGSESFQEVAGIPNDEYPIANNAPPKPVMTSALGVAGIIESRRNQKLQRILNESVLNTPDGMPLVWLGKLFGYQNIERVYGPDLLRDVCAYSASKGRVTPEGLIEGGWRHFFYGAAPGIVEKLKGSLERKHPAIQICGIYCPPFRPLTPEEEADLIAQVAQAKPDIFWIGISTPKQLYFMDQMRDKLDCKIICPVGYAFDVNAGVQEDAPDWAKYSGFQWLHRAIKQPRLWKRYLPDNPRFLLEVMLQLLHLKKYPMFVHERITAPENDAEGYPRFPAGVVSLSAMTLQSARDRVLNWVATGQRHYVNICTADTMVQCFDRPDMAKIVKNAGMATTDGMPLVWLAHHYGFKDATRVYGPDLMLALCEATAALNQRSEVKGQKSETARDQRSEVIGQASDGLPSDLCVPTSDLRPPISEKKCISHFFYGATDDVLEKLKTNLLAQFPGLQIAGMYSPPFRPLTEKEKDEVAEMINSSGANIVWCGLGTPKQDYWVAEFRPRLNAAAILAVGAAFNFHAGQVRQAPRWMMKSGLEWLFRLSAEPKRLWRRYLVGNPRFILLTWRQFMVRYNKSL